MYIVCCILSNIYPNFRVVTTKEKEIQKLSNFFVGFHFNISPRIKDAFERIQAWLMLVGKKKKRKEKKKRHRNSDSSELSV